MPYSLGIKLNNVRISNNLAKIISLSMVGLSYEEISLVTTIKESVIRNEVSLAYGLFDTQRCINALVYLAYVNEFTYDLQANGVVVLDDYEMYRLKKHMPRLLPFLPLAQHHHYDLANASSKL